MYFGYSFKTAPLCAIKSLGNRNGSSHRRIFTLRRSNSDDRISNLWGLCFRSLQTATEYCRKPQSTAGAARGITKSGPFRSIVFSETPPTFAAASQTSLILPGFFGCLTYLSGRYHILSMFFKIKGEKRFEILLKIYPKFQSGTAFKHLLKMTLGIMYVILAC